MHLIIPQVISRKSAKSMGLKHYFTGKPCLNGHITERYVLNGNCGGCRKISDKKKLAKAKEAYSLKKQHDMATHLESLINISHADAVKAGLKRYFTGQPCRNGHICERYVIGGHCLECHRISAQHERIRLKNGIELKSRDPSSKKDTSQATALANLAPQKLWKVISRETATKTGIKRFFTGVACCNGHIDERYVLSGNCVACARKNTMEKPPTLGLPKLIAIATKDAELPKLKFISRNQAREADLRRFFTGEPCTFGHIAQRYVGNMECVTCSAERKKTRYATDPEFRERYKKRETERNRRPHVRELRNAKARDYYKTPEFLDKIRERLRTDRQFSLTEKIKTLLRAALKKQHFKKNSRLQDILGCSMEFFIKHIELQFLPGMSWGNRGTWEFDHIVALATAKTGEDVIALFHHTNLRPIWRSDNRTKGSKLVFLI